MKAVRMSDGPGRLALVNNNFIVAEKLLNMKAVRMPDGPGRLHLLTIQKKT